MCADVIGDHQVPRVSIDPLGVATPYNASLPSWLSFTGTHSQQIFSGTPTATDVDEFTIILICKDRFQATVETTFNLRVWGLGFLPGYPRTSVCHCLQAPRLCVDAHSVCCCSL
jgi:hypothetical protein